MKKLVVTLTSLAVAINIIGCSNPNSENNLQESKVTETSTEDVVPETTEDSLTAQLEAIENESTQAENSNIQESKDIHESSAPNNENSQIVTEHQEVIPEKTEVDKLKEVINIPSSEADNLLSAIKSKVPNTIDLILIDIETEEQTILRIVDELGDSYFAVIDKEYNLIKVTYDSIENEPL